MKKTEKIYVIQVNENLALSCVITELVSGFFTTKKYAKEELKNLKKEYKDFSSSSFEILTIEKEK